jgi:hypothetical protein
MYVTRNRLETILEIHVSPRLAWTTEETWISNIFSLSLYMCGSLPFSFWNIICWQTRLQAYYTQTIIHNLGCVWMAKAINDHFLQGHERQGISFSKVEPGYAVQIFCVLYNCRALFALHSIYIRLFWIVVRTQYKAP